MLFKWISILFVMLAAGALWRLLVFVFKHGVTLLLVGVALYFVIRYLKKLTD